MRITRIPLQKNDPKAERVRVMIMSALLVVLLIGGAWYGKWWQYLPKRKAAVAVASAKPAKLNLAPSVAPAAGGSAANVPTVSATVTTESVAPASEAGAAPSADAVRKETGRSASPETAVQAKSKPSTAAADPPAVQARKSVVVRERPHGKVTPAVAEARTEEPVASDAPVEPPKLLKAATPVYPPDAMLNYITGDVRAEVVVDAAGHVAEVKVISGPRALESRPSRR